MELHVIFDGPPGPESGRFIECETPDGASVRAGHWIEKDNGMWALVMDVNLPEPQ